MKVLELFCGTKSISNAFKEAGHEVFTVDWEKDFNPSLRADISTLTVEDIIKLCGGKPDIIWASPDCTSYSIAAISHHRERDASGNLRPKTEYAKFCDITNEHMLELINAINPKYWFIENPRGGMRKMSFMKNLPRYTVTYCQYGDTRMKPTDIWTNHPFPDFKPACHNGDPCHVSAPRGSRTGTQGLKGSKERSRIPKALCKHIVDICTLLTNPAIHGSIT
jgi:site-specific DNA-cytosine methylase